jgi:hypothetical protein
VLGEHADEPIKIDLHCTLGERLPIRVTDLTEFVYPRGALPGFNSYPSRAALMLHLLAHTAGSMVCRELRLIQLCDITRLAARMTDADWQELVGCDTGQQRLWWAMAPLTVTERVFPNSIPAHASLRLGAGCPWLLRRASHRRSLADFSYSHLYIDPVPGLVWARSVNEMLRYLAARAWPDREQRTKLDILSRMEPFASDSRWYGQTQLARILQWLCTRPVRTGTLQPVRAALARSQ